MVSRADFIHIANMLADARVTSITTEERAIGFDSAIYALCDAFRGINPRFSREKFLSHVRTTYEKYLVEANKHRV